MGPTQPNRFHMHLGTSGGWQTNPEPGKGPTGLPNVFDGMVAAGHTARYYFSNLPLVLAYGGPVNLVTPISQFFTDAENGTLPNLCIVDPMFTALDTIGNDDHPPADVRVGQAFIASIYQALAQSPQWDRCLLLVTYDEHGGFYDHVSPPTTFDDEYPEFQQLGFRVPSVLIGPHVRRGCALGTQLDHVSVASTLVRRFGMAPLRKRVTMTNDVSSAIDPRYIDDPQPPIELPPVRVPMPKTFTRVGSGAQHQIELVRAVERAGFRFDPSGHDALMRWLLERGQALGAVEIV
jgi:phospholipase C